jgi:trehalose 6-phosphate synthase/phosphatase
MSQNFYLFVSVQERFTRNWAYISSHSLIDWAENFLLDLRKSRKNPDSLYLTKGSGSHTSLVQIDRSAEKLNVAFVTDCYRLSAKYRVFLLDNEGTLQSSFKPRGDPLTSSGTSLASQNIPGVRHDLKGLLSRGAAPSVAVLNCLKTLCEDPRNIVIITSG